MKNVQGMLLAVTIAVVLGGCGKGDEKTSIEGAWEWESYTSAVAVDDFRFELAAKAMLADYSSIRQDEYSQVIFGDNAAVTKHRPPVIAVASLSPLPCGDRPAPPASVGVDPATGREIDPSEPGIIDCYLFPNYLRSAYAIVGDSLVITDYFEGGHTSRNAYAVSFNGSRMMWRRCIDPDHFHHMDRRAFIERWRTPGATEPAVRSASETVIFKRRE